MPRLTREIVLDCYHSFPFENHPLWVSIIKGQLSYDQILRAEQQHFIRSNVGRFIREKAARESEFVSISAHKLLMETYREECTEDDSGPSHVDLIRRLLRVGGISDADIDKAEPTPGNIASIAIYKSIGDRGPLHHMIGAGAVEYYYSLLSPKIYHAYIEHYHMTPEQAETYRIHGPMDMEHAERALSIIDEETVQNNSLEIKNAVRDAFVATSLHYDGMLQAALGTSDYWNGK